jgi:hypothetical protein
LRFLELADPVCQRGDVTTGNLVEATVTHWQQGHLGQNPIEIGGLSIAGAPLSTPSVAQVMINGVFRRSCDSQQAAPPQCMKDGQLAPGWSQISPGTALKICGRSPTPPRASIEHQALTATIMVERTAQLVRRHMPANRPLGPLMILASPRFESHWTPWQVDGMSGAYEMLFADNLAYFGPTNVTPPYLALLPSRSRPDADRSVDRSVDRFEDQPYLWELPFVVAHEYGHHVEHSLGIDHFAAPRSITRQAVSEGFADLIGFAAHGGPDVDPLAGVPCLAADRSPASSHFSGGAPKIMTASLLRSLDTTAPRTMTHSLAAPCQGVLPYSPHGLGAVFAFWVREFAMLTPHFDEDPHGHLIELSIAWLQKTEERLGTGNPSNTDARKDIRAVADSIESMVQKRFSDARLTIPDQTRTIMHQKMNEGFIGLDGGDWFRP